MAGKMCKLVFHFCVEMEGNVTQQMYVIYKQWTKSDNVRIQHYTFRKKFSFKFKPPKRGKADFSSPHTLPAYLLLRSLEVIFS